MPLDFVNVTLADRVAWLGLRPVPDEVLQRHKQSEVDKHPSDWGYRHPCLVMLSPMAFIFSVFMMFFGPLNILVQSHAGTIDLWVPLTLLSMVMFVGLIMMFRRCPIDEDGRVAFNGPAEWSEHQARKWDLMVAPKEIRDLAKRVIETQGSYLVIGELRQAQRLLDPYLLLCMHDAAGNREQVCLGIWDGSTIIEKATSI